MIRACRERSDQRGVDFWSYVLLVVDILEHSGMSEEEDGTIPVDFGGLLRDQVIKKVKILWWRHPWFRELFEIVDSAPAVEKLLFHRAGGARVPRIRVNDVDHRQPPLEMPLSFFREGYLEGLLPIDRSDLKVREEEVIPVYNFVGFDPNRDPGFPGASSGSSMA